MWFVRKDGEGNFAGMKFCEEFGDAGIDFSAGWPCDLIICGKILQHAFGKIEAADAG